MSIIDTLGIFCLVALLLILIGSAIIEIVSYKRLMKSWAVIQVNLSKHDVLLIKKGRTRFVFQSSTRKSRELYPSEVMLFWKKCEYGVSFDDHTVEL